MNNITGLETREQVEYWVQRLKMKFPKEPSHRIEPYWYDGGKIIPNGVRYGINVFRSATEILEFMGETE